MSIPRMVWDTFSQAPLTFVFIISASLLILWCISWMYRFIY